MARLGPFEPEPRLAVAVSGGADSLALCLLCRDWAQARNGSLLALTVDHRLRPESADEAAAVGQKLRDLGVDHAILTWQGCKPASGIQNAARDARYRLLVEKCAGTGIFHLLLAHHREDQAETVLLRLAHASGCDGLAGMAPIRELPELRLLRPLLEEPKSALIATCAAAGLTWVEDPSNRCFAFARPRLRAAGAALSHEGLSPQRLANTSRRLGAVRAALDRATAALLARAVTISQAGFLLLEVEALRLAPEEISRRALLRCLATIGGAAHPPRSNGLDRLLAEIFAGLDGDRTLSGCRVCLLDAGRLLVSRELRACAGACPLAPAQPIWWDRRFLVRLLSEHTGLTIGPLGPAGWSTIGKHISPASRRAIPEPARATLPALCDHQGLLAVPHLSFSRMEASTVATVRFLPSSPLAGFDFAVV